MDNINCKYAFICDNVNELNIEHRKHILQMIFNSSDRNKIKEKGVGSQINMNEISPQLINKIFIFIEQTLKNQQFDII